MSDAEKPQPREAEYDKQKAKRYANTRYRLTVINFVYLGLFLVLFVFSGGSVALRQAAMSLAGSELGGQAVYIIGFIVLTTVVLAPLNYYESYVVEHRFDLSNQTLGAWLADELKTMLLSTAIFLPALLGAYFLLSSAGPAWWVYGAILWTGFNFFLAYIAPVVMMPLFNKFEPLEDADLKNALTSLADKAKVRVSEVLRTDMSRRTKKANAFFAGVGNTKRIVLGDTLLDEFTGDEILTVVGHEMGHWKLKHLVKNTVAGVIGALVGFYAADRILAISLAPLGLAGMDDIAGLPLIILTFMALGAVGMPIMNGLSRRFERQADLFGLELVGKPGATISTFEKLAARNLADPDPSPVIELILFSHPSVKNRISAVRRFQEAQPRET